MLAWPNSQLPAHNGNSFPNMCDNFGLRRAAGPKGGSPVTAELGELVPTAWSAAVLGGQLLLDPLDGLIAH